MNATPHSRGVLTAAATPQGSASWPALEETVAAHGSRILAGLIRQCGGDFQLAEDALQEALLTAVERWPTDGVPARPEAWLFTTARRKALDKLRRDQTLARKREQLQALLEDEQRSGSGPLPGEQNEMLQDDRLRLIFTCCHPSLAIESQVALTLRTVAGLDVPAIAKAFLTNSETMAKRLTRARRKIRDARIPYQVPAETELPDRLAGVLGVIYLVFNEGYVSSSGESLLRGELCEEAIRLARLLVSLMPEQPEAMGLLALMLLIDSRRQARTDASGDLLSLEEQDRGLWDRQRIEEGSALLQRALEAHKPGPYQRQAAIAALHAESQRAEDTDWQQIALLYRELLRDQPSPVVELNLAAAVGMAFGSDAGLRRMDAIDDRGALDRYYLAHAARADLLRRAGRNDEAATAYQRAIELCANAAELRFLRRRLREVGGSQ